MVALTVLSLLVKEAMHPYEIERRIRDWHKSWAMGKTRSLYHAVDRLVADGLIEPVETVREGKRPERTVYAITELGREEQHAWLTDLVQHPAPEHPLFLVAVSFLVQLTAKEAVDSLRIRAIALEGQIAGVEVWVRALNQELHLPRAVTLEVELQLALHRAELEWVRSIAAEIQSGKLNLDQKWLMKEFAGERLRVERKGETA
jgi:DNA-binding PadR family transcriptional regulator